LHAQANAKKRIKFGFPSFYVINFKKYLFILRNEHVYITQKYWKGLVYVASHKYALNKNLRLTIINTSFS